MTLTAGRKNFIANFYGNSQGKLELANEEETNKVLTAIDGGVYQVEKVRKAKKKRTPAPPFITSTLQQEASRKLSMTAKRTMMVAQELYEGVAIEGQDRPDHLYANRLSAHLRRRLGRRPGLY